MGDLKKSVDAYYAAIELFNSMNDVWNEAETEALLSIVMSDIDIKKAITLAQKSLDTATQTGAKSVAEQAYSALILAEEKRGNYKQALNYAKKKEDLINKIKNDVLNKRLAEMLIILDVEKKERAYEILKREKSVISLELTNKENKLNLLEKEAIINDLKNKNNLLVFSVTGVAVVIGLFIIGRIYFNMRYRFILSISLILLLLLYSFNASSKDIIKLTQGSSSLDVRPKYTLGVLKKALKFSEEKYGDYEIITFNQSLTKEAQIMEIHDGSHVNLTMAMTSPDWEYLALPIRIPIRRGVGSYRLLTINKSNTKNFQEIKTLKELKSFTIGLQKKWIMNELLEEQGFIIVESLTYDGVFRMLNKNRFDFIPRGIHEAYDEISLRKDELPNIMIEPHIALHIPHPYYIFVSPKYPRIAERIEYGLEKMIAQGVLQEMFDEAYADFITKANLHKRTIIEIKNNYLTKETPLERKELWLNFDLEK